MVGRDDWDQDDTVVNLPLRAMPARLPDPTTIPPREWLYGTRLIRKFVTVLVAPGGVGKSIYGLGVAMALASGKPILGETVHHRVNSWCMNLEDPLEEMDRRVAAMMIRHNLTRFDLEGRLFLNSGRDRRVTLATLSSDGYEILYPDKDAIIAAMLQNNIGHLAVDPFIKSHQLEENSNPHMDAAATAWAEVGQATGAAIELIHHTRKGAATDVEAARGGKALTDAARVGQVMTSMAKEEADGMGIKETDRWRYVRIEDAKANLAPRAEKALWFVLEGQSLGNVTDDYPRGDNVASIACWDAPEMLKTLAVADINRALDVIALGMPDGSLYAPTQRGGASSSWAGKVLVDRFGMTDGQAKTIINGWLKSGLLVAEDYTHPKWRRKATGVRVENQHRPTPEGVEASPP